MSQGPLSGCLSLFRKRQPCFITDDYPLPDDVLDGCRVMGEHRPEFHYLYRPRELFVHPDDFAEVRRRLGEDVDPDPRRTEYPTILVAMVSPARLLPEVIARDLAGLRVGPHHIFRTASHIHVTPSGAPAETTGTLTVLGSTATPKKVAVLDTGVNLSDPFFQGCSGDSEGLPTGTTTLQPFVGHGSFVTGIIITRTANASVQSVAVIANNGLVADLTLSAALQNFRTNPVDVINLSAASQVFNEEMVATVKELEALLNAQPNLVVVAAAGNDGSTAPTYPAAMSQVIGVAAVRPNRAPACFTNRGPWVNAHAIGVDRVSKFFTYTGQVVVPAPVTGCSSAPDNGQRSFNGWARWSGTSFATPVVTAEVVGLLLRPGATRQTILAKYPKTTQANGIGVFVAG